MSVQESFGRLVALTERELSRLERAAKRDQPLDPEQFRKLARAVRELTLFTIETEEQREQPRASGRRNGAPVGTLADKLLAASGPNGAA